MERSFFEVNTFERVFIQTGKQDEAVFYCFKVKDTLSSKLPVWEKAIFEKDEKALLLFPEDEGGVFSLSVKTFKGGTSNNACDDSSKSYKVCRWNDTCEGSLRLLLGYMKFSGDSFAGGSFELYLCLILGTEPPSLRFHLQKRKIKEKYQEKSEFQEWNKKFSFAAINTVFLMQSEGPTIPQMATRIHNWNAALSSVFDTRSLCGRNRNGRNAALEGDLSTFSSILGTSDSQRMNESQRKTTLKAKNQAKWLPYFIANSFTDIDPTFDEQNEYFQSAIPHERIAEGIREISRRVAELNLDDKWKAIVLGAVSNEFFSHCGWKAESPKSIPNWHFVDRVMDIDQVTFDFKDFQCLWKDRLSGCKSAFDFLKQIDDEIKEKVFLGEPSQSLYRLNYRNIANQLRTGKGGHTYQDRRTRRKYSLISCGASTSDVLKCSVAFRKQTLNFTEIECNPPAKEFLGQAYAEIEGVLTTKHFGGRQIGWSEKTNKEKIIIAIYFTCYFLANRDGNHQNKFGFQNFLKDCSEVTVDIANGNRVPFLFPFCLSLLENILGDGSVALDMVYESYGAKSRVSTEYNDQLNIMAEKLINDHSRLSTGRIWKFSNMCSSSSLSRRGTLIIGFGCSFRVMDERNDPQYPVISLDNITKNEEQPRNTDYVIDPDDYVVDQSDDEDYENINEDGNQYEDESEEFLSVIDFKDCEEYYSVLGRTLPQQLQPSTRWKDNIRYQHYSVSLKHALGEFNSRLPATSAASNLYNFLAFPENGRCQIIIENYEKALLNFHDLARENMKRLQDDGNTARLEQTRLIKTSDIEREIKEGLQDCYKTCKRCTNVYAVKDIVAIAEFFLLALQYRTSIIIEATKAKDIEFTHTDATILSLIPEISAYIKNFYSGRRTSADRNIFGKNAGVACSRPILTPDNKGVKEITAKLFGKSFNICHYWEPLLLLLKLPVPFKQAVYGIRDAFNTTAFRKKIICIQCMQVFDINQTNITDHACVIANCSEADLRQFTDPLVRQKVKNIRTEWLTNEQRCFVDIALKQEHNLLLTGEAGTGKSAAAKQLLLELLVKNRGVQRAESICLTGQGALILGGKTIHSFFGLSIEEEDDFNGINPNFGKNFLRKMKTELMQTKHAYIKGLDVLIIDECGLLTGHGLENIDYMLSAIRERPDDWFGGMKILLVGDPLQTAPFVKDSKIPVTFFFEDKAFISFKVFFLKQIMRQKTEAMRKVLNNFRTGRVSREDLDIVNGWGTKIARKSVEDLLDIERKIVEADPKKWKYDPKRSFYPVPDRFYEDYPIERLEMLSESSEGIQNLLVICAENREVDTICEDLDKLDLSSRIFEAEDTCDVAQPETAIEGYKEKLDTATRLVKHLRLYKNQIVRFTSNQVNQYVANNMLARVQSVNDDSVLVKPIFHSSEIQPKVIAVNKLTRTCELWDKSKQKVKITRKQFPLESAIASNIYVIQGTTLHPDSKVVVCNQRFQQPGCVYTALSRARDPGQVLVLYPLCSQDIIVHPTALAFDDHHSKFPSMLSDALGSYPPSPPISSKAQHYLVRDSVAQKRKEVDGVSAAEKRQKLDLRGNGL